MKPNYFIQNPLKRSFLLKNVKSKNGIILLILFSLSFLYACNPSFKSLSQEKNKYKLTSIEQLADANYAQKIEDFYNKGKFGYFNGKENTAIYYKVFKQAETEKAAILIASGRTEAAVKYKELIFDLYKLGYSIYIHDHRGQGLSGRMTENIDMGYIDTFQYYVDDMKYFYDKVLKKDKHQKIYLLSHSMGGAISMTYIEQNPKDFDAAAFSSPMLGFTFGNCAAVKILAGKEIDYALGQGKYNDDKVSFDDNHLTGSKVRYQRMVDAFEKEPKAKLGGATYQWVHKSCLQFKYIFNHVDQIQTPFILFSAQNEQIVNTSAHQSFIKKAKEHGKNCVAYTIENAQHELFIEKDKQRIETLNETLNFFNRF